MPTSVLASRYNTLRNQINLILGTSAISNPTYGYGENVSTTTKSGTGGEPTPETINSDKISALDYEQLYIDIVRCRAHQIGPSAITIDEFVIGNVEENPSTADKIEEAYISSLESLSANVLTDRYLIDATTQASTQNLLDFQNSHVTSTYNNNWTAFINHIVQVTWPSAEARRHFFNAGGEVRFNASVLYTGSQQKTADWQSAMSNMGTISFKADRSFSNSSVGQGQTVGNNNIGSSYSLCYRKDAGLTYSLSAYELYAREISDQTIQFKVLFDDPAPGGWSIDETVLGSFTSNLGLLIPDGSVSINGTSYDTVVYPSNLLPVGSEIVSLSAGTPPTPSYNLLRSTASINEGQSVTITLSTNNVSNGTVIPYTISGSASQADLGLSSLSGSFIVGVTNSVTLTAASDLTTEGNESFTLSLSNGADSISVTIIDSSTTQPAAGTLLSTFCQGVDLYGSYANGTGGTYNQLIESNSASCGYTSPFAFTVSPSQYLVQGTAWDIGTVSLGNSSSASITIQNTGGTTGTVTVTDSSSPSSTTVSIDSQSSQSYSIAPGDSQVVTLTVTPTAIFDARATNTTYHYTFTGSNGTSTRVYWTGSAVNLNVPQVNTALAVDSSNPSFPTVGNETTYKTFTYTGTVSNWTSGLQVSWVNVLYAGAGATNAGDFAGSTLSGTASVSITNSPNPGDGSYTFTRTAVQDSTTESGTEYFGTRAYYGSTTSQTIYAAIQDTSQTPIAKSYNLSIFKNGNPATSFTEGESGVTSFIANGYDNGTMFHYRITGVTTNDITLGTGQTLTGTANLSGNNIFAPSFTVRSEQDVDPNKTLTLTYYEDNNGSQGTQVATTSVNILNDDVVTGTNSAAITTPVDVNQTFTFTGNAEPNTTITWTGQRTVGGPWTGSGSISVPASGSFSRSSLHTGPGTFVYTLSFANNPAWSPSSITLTQQIRAVISITGPTQVQVGQGFTLTISGGLRDGAFTVNGVSSPAFVFNSSGQATIQGTPTIEGVSSYTVVDVAGGNSASWSVTSTQSYSPTLSYSPSSPDTNDTITLSATGGRPLGAFTVTGTWSTTSTTQTINGNFDSNGNWSTSFSLGAGSYSYTLTTNNDGSTSTSFTVTEAVTYNPYIIVTQNTSVPTTIGVNAVGFRPGVGYVATVSTSRASPQSFNRITGTSGTDSFSFSVSQGSPYSFPLGVTFVDDDGNSGSDQITVTLEEPIDPPTIGFAPTSGTINSTTYVLSWDAANASSATVTVTAPDGGVTVITDELSGSRTSTLGQTGTWTAAIATAGGTRTASATVSPAAVVIPVPSVSLTASGSGYTGEVLTATFNGNTNNSPAATGSFTVIKNPSGSSIVTDSGFTGSITTVANVAGTWTATTTTPYYNANGVVQYASATDSISITTYVPPPAAPTITGFWDPASITTGQFSTFAWSASNAQSASLSGIINQSSAGTSGTRNSGTQYTPGTKTVTVTATGAGGTTSQSYDLTVNAPVSYAISLSVVTFSSTVEAIVTGGIPNTSYTMGLFTTNPFSTVATVQRTLDSAGTDTVTEILPAGSYILSIVQTGAGSASQSFSVNNIGGPA